MPWTRSTFCSGGQCAEVKFVKSSFSLNNGTCVEAAPVFAKSSACTSLGNCAEVAYVTSSACSDAACVEVGFTSASACANGSCVEVGAAGDRVLLRDSKLGDASPILEFTPEAWAEFLEFAPTVA